MYSNKPPSGFIFWQRSWNEVRLTHKKYASQQEAKFYRQPTKKFHDLYILHVCVEQKRKELTQIISRMISKSRIVLVLHDFVRCIIWKLCSVPWYTSTSWSLYLWKANFILIEQRRLGDDAQLPKLIFKIISRYQTSCSKASKNMI